MEIERNEEKDEMRFIYGELCIILRHEYCERCLGILSRRDER